MSTDAERGAAGLAVRKHVVGAAQVEKTMAGADAFTAEWQEYVNRACWGETWTRTAIDPKTRSLLTVGMLALMGKSTELMTHTRGAFANGASVEEIKDVLFHVAVYAGVPAAFDAFRTLQPVIAERSAAK